MAFSKIDPTLSLTILQNMAESQFFDRKSARITSVRSPMKRVD